MDVKSFLSFNIADVIGIAISVFTLIMAGRIKGVISKKLDEYKLRRDGAEDLRVLKGALKSIREDNICTDPILWNIFDVINRNTNIGNVITAKYKEELDGLRRLVNHCTRCERTKEPYEDEKIDLCQQLHTVITLFEKEIYA